MKKSVMCVVLVASILSAKSYQAKIEAYESHVVASEVNGEVVRLDPKDELSVQNKEVITIEHTLEAEQLINYEQKLANIDEQIKTTESNYEKVLGIVGKSKFEKDNMKISLLSLKSSRSDLANTVATLKNTLKKKHIYANNCYVKKFYVKQGEFVSMGAKLMECEDQSAARLVIYVDAQDIVRFKEGKFTIDGKSDHPFVVEKIANTPDPIYISSYRVELVAKGYAGLFGTLAQVTTEESSSNVEAKK